MLTSKQADAKSALCKWTASTRFKGKEKKKKKREKSKPAAQDDSVLLSIFRLELRQSKLEERFERV